MTQSTRFVSERVKLDDYRNSEKFGSRFNLDFEKLPSKFIKPFCISLSSGMLFISPRAANDGGDDRKRLATR